MTSRRTPDLFASAVTVPSKPKAKGAAKDVVTLEGFSVFAAAKSLVDALTSFMKPRELAMKAACSAKSLEKYVGLKKPESFLVDDEAGKGMFTLKKLTAAASLSEAAKAKFDAFAIPYETVEVQAELFFINPELLANPVTRRAISDALGRVRSLDGLTIIMRQEPISKATVSAKSIEAIMKMENTDEQALISSMAQTPAFSQVAFEGTPAAALELLESVGFTFTEEVEDAD